MIDVFNGTTQAEVLPAARRTASANGSAVDMQDFIGRVAFILMTSAGGGTSPTLDVKLQDSADGSSGWADISGATYTQVTDSADATESIGVKIDEVKRYVRAVATIGGTSPTFDSGVCVVGKKQNN